MSEQNPEQETEEQDEAPVDDYTERPYEDAKADPEDIEKAEDRPEKDQIEDYHETHPTLKRDDEG